MQAGAFLQINPELVLRYYYRVGYKPIQNRLWYHLKTEMFYLKYMQQKLFLQFTVRN